MPTVSFTTSGALQKSALREANERLVLDSIRRNPGISRAEIARVTGLARTSVTFVVDRLLRSRLVQEEEKPGNGTQAGRPPTALRLRGEARLAIGVEIARPRSRAVLIDLKGEVLGRRTVAWHGDTTVFLGRIRAAIQALIEMAKSRRVLGVGISLPGTIDKWSGRVIGAEALGWFGVEVGEILRRDIELPLFFENDANLSALAEQWWGSSAGEALRYFVYVRMQGGLGTGVVVDGRVLHGVASAGAEFGHVMLDAKGRACNCGNRGCWEQYASDSALVRAYREMGGSTAGPDRVLEDSLEIVNRARSGDDAAVRALRETAVYLALGFVNLIAALNPQAIIMGEPFASAWDLVEEVVWEELRRRVPAYSLNGLQLLPSRIGTDSALRGAAALVLVHFFTRFDHTKDDSLPNGVSLEARA
jgi:predicted NBD/HSP70 family sugar kinase